MPGDWTRSEVEATVADYRAMLALELKGGQFNKAERNRNLQRLLDGRSRGSIERKHQNISAIMRELEYPYIKGYKPLRNYQELLFQVVKDQVASDAALLALIDQGKEATTSTKKKPDSR